MKNKKFLMILIFFSLILSLNVAFASDSDTNDTFHKDTAISYDLNQDSENIFNNFEDSSSINDSKLTFNLNDNEDIGVTDEIYITPSTIFDNNMSVEISSNNQNATIYYTLDGSNPIYSDSRLIYNDSFIINESTTVHYTVIDDNGNYPLMKLDSIKTYSPISYIKENVIVEIDSNSNIHYTLDGSDPIFSDTRILYTNPFYIHNRTVIRFESHSHKYLSINFYTNDFSVTYLKKNDMNQSSEAIWSQYQGNNNKTGVTNYIGPLTNVSKWSNTNIVSSGSAVIDKNGHIYVGSDDGYLYCLNNQGLVIWRYGTTSKIICTPTIGSDGNIYFTNWLNSTLYCISPDGELMFKYNLGEYNTGSSPIFGYDNTLYVLSGNDNISILFAFKDNNLSWNCTLPAITGSTPTIANDGTLYMVSTHHELVAVNWDGSVKFVKGISDFGVIFLAYSDTISIGDNGLLYVLNQPGEAAISFKPSHDYNIINAYLPNGTRVWSIGDNTCIWSSGDKSASGTPSYYKGILYITGQKSLTAINASNGNILWSQSIANANNSLSSPLISGDEIIYLSQGNVVYAFNLTGEQIWNYTLTGKYGGPISFSSPTLSDDGTLIVTTNQGIFAFNDISADFTYEHVNNTERTIQFTDLSTKGNNSYYWSFGDGYYSSERNPSHVYSKAGKYRVELLVNHEGINLARNTTIVVESWDITPPSPVSASIGGKSTKGGVFDETQSVDLSASDDYSIANIYYTVDGSNPIDSATRRTYVEPVSIEAYTVLRAVAVDTSNNWGKVSTFTFNITDSINVNDKINSTLIQNIQKLLDNAEKGSKFVFDYDTLYGANFTINKPLNIITNNNTKLVGNGFQPVFTIGENAKGSSINGFTIINDGADGILIKKTKNISVKDSIVSANDAVGINIINSTNTLVKDTKVNNSTNGVIVNESSNTKLERVNVKNSYDNGVWILNSKKTTLKDSLLENNGQDPYLSSAHQVLLYGSGDTTLLNNRINYGVFGIRLKNNNNGVIIDKNTVYEGVGDAILLEGRFSNVNITRNDLDGSFMGINFNGYSENVNVVSNLVHNMHSHPGEPDSGAEYDAFYGFKHGTDLYGCYCNCIQVWELADNFHNAVHIENNVCIKTEHRSWESRKTHTYTQSDCNGYGYNLWDGSDSYTGMTNGATSYIKGFVDLVIDRVGDSSYRLRLINRLTNDYLSDIPAFDVKFTAGSYSQTVKFVDNQAVATFDVASAITNIMATISSYISQSTSWNIPISDGYSSSNKDHDSGYEAGEAINNPDPKVPSIVEYIKAHSGNNGNGHGTGTGNGQGSGNGHGSSGHGGSNINGREGEVKGNSNNLIRTNNGTSQSVGVQAAAEGSSDSVEGGSESGETQDSAKAYEVTKEISKNINNNMKFILAVILFYIIVILGYGYKKGKDDGDEIQGKEKD